MGPGRSQIFPAALKGIATPLIQAMSISTITGEQSMTVTAIGAAHNTSCVRDETCTAHKVSAMMAGAHREHVYPPSGHTRLVRLVWFRRGRERNHEFVMASEQFPSPPLRERGTASKLGFGLALPAPPAKAARAFPVHTSPGGRYLTAASEGVETDRKCEHE